MSQAPRVAIGIPAYNRADGLRKTLDALCNQSYTNIEIHVSDDCSPDSRVGEVIEDYSKKDSRVKGYRQSQNLGIIGNHEFLLSKISKEIPYMMWACDDDDWHYDYVKVCVEALEKHPDAVLCTTDNLYLHEDELIDIRHEEHVDTLGMNDPADRFKKVLSNILWWNHSYYGVVRRKLYDKVPLRSVFAFDIIHIAQFSLWGQYVKIQQPYFVKSIGGYGSRLKRNLSSIKDNRSLSRMFPRLSFFLHLRKTIHQSELLNAVQKRELTRVSLGYIVRRSAFSQTLLDKFLWLWNKGMNALKFAGTWWKIGLFRSAWQVHIHRLPRNEFSASKNGRRLYADKLESEFDGSIDLFSNYKEFLELKQRQNAVFEYDAESERNFVTIQDIRFKIKKGFYGFLLHEIFVEEVYRYHFSSPSIVVDIGSNVGIAALYFARQENVKEVFGFEPFKETYDAAMVNLELNPGLSSEVHIENIGLSDRDEELTVGYSFETSTLSSIKKGEEGSADAANRQAATILIRRASEVLRPIFEKHSDQRKVLKLDTEGSEHEIIHDLDRGELLDQFDFIMMEWHGVGHQKLVDCLERNGFEVRVSDLDYSPLFGYTGMIYAQNPGKNLENNRVGALEEIVE